ncbi:MAG: hypothetical protein HY996_01310 [Micrococcales bacterium]|nr:hypothetical protein [Micrococcales bacterium]
MTSTVEQVRSRGEKFSTGGTDATAIERSGDDIRDVDDEHSILLVASAPSSPSGLETYWRWRARDGTPISTA